MKTKFKFAVVLNAHESAVIATILSRINGKTDTGPRGVEEKRVVDEFLKRRSHMEHVLGHVSEGPH